MLPLEPNRQRTHEDADRLVRFTREARLPAIYSVEKGRLGAVGACSPLRAMPRYNV
jgi:hypothetical protein